MIKRTGNYSHLFNYELKYNWSILCFCILCAVITNMFEGVTASSEQINNKNHNNYNKKSTSLQSIMHEKKERPLHPTQKSAIVERRKPSTRNLQSLQNKVISVKFSY